jgi:NADPH:quinone reductase-like Zn-dependent oxidoreductase
MQAIVMTHRPKKGEFPNDLRLTTVVKPEPRKNEVLIKVVSATITIDDINFAEGAELGGIPIAPSPSSKKPFIPGIELSGVVEEIGPNVTKFNVGDSVFGGSGSPLKRKGAWAEYCCTKEKILIRKPDYLTHSEAAACALAGVVAYAAVIQGCNLQKRHRILIVGASGGIGTLAVQMAIQQGAYVIAVCSKKNKALVESLGADEVIDYTSTSFVEALSKENDNKLDFVVDLVGGKEIEKGSMKVLKRSGTFITIVGPVRYVGDKLLGWMGIAKLIMYIGWRMFHSQFKGPKYRFVGATRATYPFLIEMFKTHSIKPVIDKTIHFNEKEISEAINYVRTHRATGRVIISINHT